MTRSSMLGTTIIALAVLAAPAARAQVTQDQATALEKQVRDWASGLIGQNVDLSGVPIHILPDGDHYRLEATYAGAGSNVGLTITGAPITAALKPLDGNRWAIDNLTLPSPFTVKFAPKPAAGGSAPAQTLSDTGLATGGDFTVKIDQQQSHTIFDPTLATPSTSDVSLSGMSQVVNTAMGRQVSTIAHMSGHYVMTPKDGKTVSLQGEASADGYTISQPTQMGKPLTISMDRLHATGTIQDLSFQRTGEMIHTISALAALGNNHNPAVERELGHQLLASVAELLASAEGEESVDGLRVDVGGQGGSLKKLSISSGFGAPNDKAEWHLKIALDSLDSPLVPAQFRDYLPRHVSLAPRISGVSKSAGMKLLLQAIDNPDSDNQPPEEVFGELVQGGPVTVGLDELALDIGVASLTGTGHIDIAGTTPSDVTGQFDFKMTGLDELIRRATTTPMLKQAAPVLTFLKGLGAQQGNATVWAIKFADNKLTVNDADMSSMIPGLGGDH